MADFKPAFEFMIQHEDAGVTGVTVNDNNGYKVRYGLNAKYHPDLVANHYYELPSDKALIYAKLSYFEWYWVPIRGLQIVDQAIANKFFDQTVPMGVGSATKCMQQALNELGNTLDVDGHVGQMTLAAINAADSAQLMPLLKQKLQDHYEAVVQAHPEYADCMKGWTARLEA